MDTITSNIEDAKTFIEKLTGSADTPVTFQIIPEAPGCTVKPEVRHGKLADLWLDLEIVNLEGACVSVCPNETDLRGRREENMIRARALWVDWDDGNKPVTFETLSPKLPPTMTVQSKRGQHNYWVLAPVPKLTPQQRAEGTTTDDDIDSFRRSQRDLARALGTDTAVSDPTRAMRLPGLLHRKGEPFLVRLVQANDRRYRAWEVAAAFPAAPEPKRESEIDEEEAGRRLEATPPDERLQQARYYIEEQAPDAIQGSSGRPTTLSVLCRLGGYGITEDEIQELAELYNDTKCDPSWSARDLAGLLRWCADKETPGQRLWMPRGEWKQKGSLGEAPPTAERVAQRPGETAAPAAESKQATAIRYVRDCSERLFGVAGALSLDTRSGQIKIGDKLLEVAEGITIARANLGSIPDAVYQPARGAPRVMDVTREDMRDAIVHVAKANSCDPVREYLEVLPSWDGVERSQGLLDALRVEEPKPLHRAMLRRTLIAAVRRVFEPGCKVDTVCVLHAPDGGEGKSTFWRKLFGGDRFFSDARLDLESKDAAMLIDRFWINEWSEMAALKSNATGETIKAFLSSQRDDYRAPYAATVTSHPRRSLFVGTCNEGVILRDNGGNRRFWIIPNVGEVDLAWVERNQAQLLAQAFAEYRRGEQCYLTKDEQAENAVNQREHMHEAPGTDLVEKFVTGRTTASAREIVAKFGIAAFCGLGLGSNRGAEMKVAEILKRLGWKAGARISNVRHHVAPTSGPAPAEVGSAARIFGKPNFNQPTNVEDVGKPLAN